MTTNQRISLVTLGVADLQRARDFYRAWGWVPRVALDEIVFFQMNGLGLALYPLDLLARDLHRAPEVAGMGGMTLAQNYATESDVAERFQAAVAAEATVLHEPAAADWGGYSGYIADPDGHVWELARNPFWDLADDGSVTIPAPTE
jgi:hypothetical protein